ncbi:MAG: hypothetical protein QW409_03875 [Candidatus Aenigmatarchaeota archaeon]
MTNIFSLVIILIIIGILFFVAFQIFLFNFSKSLEKQRFYEEVEKFISTVERISKLGNKYFYYEYQFLYSNITIKENKLKINYKDFEYVYYLPFKTQDIEIYNTGKYCILKENEIVRIVDCRKIDYLIDNICTPIECRTPSQDCYGPNSQCINDGYCNIDIGENCKNSNDCIKNDAVCCPEDPSSDSSGNTNRYNLKEGEECYCNNQCASGLTCNPTTKDFTSYKSGKACCPPGKSWNGKECVNLDTLDIFIVPVQITDENLYLSSATSFIKHFLEVSPFRECKNKDDIVRFWIVNISDCPETANKQCSDHCYDCIDIARECARKMEKVFGVNYDKFVALTTGGGWSGGCAQGIPSDGSSSTAHFCSMYVCIPTHELGHQLGLGHVNCNVDCHACYYYSFFNGPAPNCPDCNHPERAKFIMDYCPPMESFGPAGYKFLSEEFIGNPPYFAGLGRWMKYCIR